VLGTVRGDATVVNRNVVWQVLRVNCRRIGTTCNVLAGTNVPNKRGVRVRRHVPGFAELR
jgi:hypothetical protein